MKIPPQVQENAGLPKREQTKARVQKNPTQKSQATHSSLFEPSPRMVTWRKTENMEAIREYAECAKNHPAYK